MVQGCFSGLYSNPLSLVCLAFGGSFRFLMALYTYLLTKKYGSYKWMKTHHERETFPIPYKEVFELCLRVIDAEFRGKIEKGVK
ncbi:MAG: hypothetical protein DRP01_02685 [Archaeoglobales archaeon]|nr:MAG: hypothetical protein DRP01_02685 [Archaeoglobales archaeon]